MKDKDEKLKALQLLTKEFKHKKYGVYVRGELNVFISGSSEEIGFQTDSSDVILSLSLSGAVIEYDYWDEDLDDYICGKEELTYEVVLCEICKVVGSVD